MKKYLVFVLLLSFTQAFSQQIISGKVIDAQTNEGLPGVTIRIEGTDKGVVSDYDGNFKISVNDDNAVLEFSFIGYKNQKINTKNQSVINISLIEDVTSLDEVVVTAIGIERPKSEIGYASETLKTEDITKASNPDLLGSLSGKVAGLQVNSTTGALGGSTKIILRGRSSINNGNNQPLIIVDGIPINNSQFVSQGNSMFGSAPDFSNAASDLNPDDIASITVLKGPAAAALYGSSASSGAMIITTKTGKSGKGEVSFSSIVTISNPLILPKFQTQYSGGENGQYAPDTFWSWGERIEGQTVTNPNLEFPGQPESVSLRSYDRYDEVYETGVSIQNSATFSGGNDKGVYRLSVTQSDNKGIIPENYYDRLNFSGKASVKLSERLKSTFSASYATNESNVPDGGPSSVPWRLTGIPNHVDVNVWRNYESADGEHLEYGQFDNNLFWELNKNKTITKRNRFIGSMEFQYDLVKDFIKIYSRTGIDMYVDNRKGLTAVNSFNLPDGAFYEQAILSENFVNDTWLTVNHDLTSNLSISGLLGYNIVDEKAKGTLGEGIGLITPDLYSYNNSTSEFASDFLNRRRLIGVYGSLQFGWKDYLFIELTGRNDKSSTLPVQNNSFFYPSITGSWLVSETFDLTKTPISHLKIRSNLSKVGNDVKSFYLFDQLFFPSQSGIPINFPFGGQPGFTLSNGYADPNLTPEFTRSWELGFEAGLFDDRMNIDFTYYNSSSFNQIINTFPSPSVGFGFNTVNNGEIDNSGIELLISGYPIFDPDGFSWEATLNYTRNRNIVQRLPNAANGYLSITGSSTDIAAVEGQPYPALRGQPYLRDDEGRLVLTENGAPRLDSAQYLGTTVPDWMMGITNKFSYKGLELSVLLDIRIGGLFYSLTAARMRQYGAAEETLVGREGLVVEGVVEQDDGSYEEATFLLESSEDYWKSQDLFQSSELGLFDASFLMLREVSLTYDLPEAWLASVKMKQAQVGIVGRNLWLSTANPHAHPEMGVTGFRSVEGYEEGQVPSLRSFGFKISGTF